MISKNQIKFDLLMANKNKVFFVTIENQITIENYLSKNNRKIKNDPSIVAMIHKSSFTRGNFSEGQDLITIATF